MIKKVLRVITWPIGVLFCLFGGHDQYVDNHKDIVRGFTKLRVATVKCRRWGCWYKREYTKPL